MKELFIPYTEALELKELGFNLPCFAIYDLEYKVKWSIDKPFFKNDAIGFTLAPLYTQAFKWFRDKYNLILDILPFYDEEQLPLSLTNKQKPKGYFIWDYYDDEFDLENPINYKIYEEAELECLRKLIEIVKEQKK